MLPKADAIASGGPILTHAQSFTKLIYAAFPALNVEVLLQEGFVDAPDCVYLYPSLSAAPTLK